MGANILSHGFNKAITSKVNIKPNKDSNKNTSFFDRLVEKIEVKALTNDQIIASRMNAYESIL